MPAFPAFYWRAPLRHFSGPQIHQVLSDFSRLLLAGSIAAALTAPPSLRFPWLFPPSTGGLHCGPVHVGRVGKPGLLFPPSTGGLHCGAKPSAATGDRLRLFPPSTGGLHCGDGCQMTGGPWDNLFPPSTGGLHCGPRPRSPSRCPPSSFPAFYWRAPLRQPHRDELDIGCLRFSRLLLAGSIAALRPPRRLVVGAELFPPSTGGLHCGSHRNMRIGLPMPLFPPSTGGLHCGALTVKKG